MPAPFIDVWNVASFDLNLHAALTADAALIRDFFETSRENFIQRELSDRTQPHPTNPFADDIMDLKDRLHVLMSDRTIRGWHHTRMTDREVRTLRQDGIHVSSISSTRARIDALVADGAFSPAVADALMAASPFTRGQADIRTNQFWVTSHPHEADDSAVELLLESWGGEAAYFWLKDPEQKLLLTKIGQPRIIEIAVPLRLTRHAYSAAEAVLSTFGRTLGSAPESRRFDLYSWHPLPPEAVLAVHSAGAPDFERIGRGYPVDYADPDLGRSEALFAEIDARRANGLSIARTRVARDRN
ncbi:hypothetical protein [Brevundimonas naejangsanensis]|uniref:hypothetical protein n=1 Tax=Brevundimonas naejangsanensis TaxID=588932 RepID=UPI00320902AB